MIHYIFNSSLIAKLDGESKFNKVMLSILFILTPIFLFYILIKI